MTERYQFGELKKQDPVAINVKVTPAVKAMLNRLRGGRSWGKFLADIATELNKSRTT